MVPIVEPEVLMDGNHSAEICLTKTSEVIKKCFEELILQKVDLKGVILKPNMILPGSKSDQKISSDEIAELTLKCLNESVPTEVPGIAFLSGGQRKKLVIAMALLGNPKVLLLDEPTAQVDQESSEKILELIQIQLDSGKTLVISTHQPEWAKPLKPRICQLEYGTITSDTLWN